VIAYVATLRERNLSARTIANHCATLNAFLRRYGDNDKVKKRFVPKGTEKKVRTYAAGELKAIFMAANAEERILFRFFLRLGIREREVMFAAWRDIDFEHGLFHVTDKPDMGFTIKDKEERLIPNSSGLLGELRKRYEKRAHDRWISPPKEDCPTVTCCGDCRSWVCAPTSTVESAIRRAEHPARMLRAASNWAFTNSGERLPHFITKTVYRFGL
jgi:integrase